VVDRARALVLTLRLLVADEPVSMLDVSVRAGILALLREVRDAMGLTAVYISHDLISHDLALVRYLCERTVVMYLGTVVEDGPTAEIVRNPRHPYTRALVARRPRARCRPVARAAADHRQRPRRAQAAIRLPLPRPLPARVCPLRRGGAVAARDQRRASRGLPPRLGQPSSVIRSLRRPGPS
jgi:peptide/nickel transport system ATP-binding protein